MQGASTAACPKCSTALPEGALFCFKCGTPTPPVVSGAGEMKYTPASDAAGAQQRAELQRLLGEACELRGLLGRGGFADVYEAWDSRLKRSLAVKTLRSDLVTSSGLVERFRLEAEAIAQLRHPHVIPIYSVGGEGTVAYFIMPKVDGESLASLLGRNERISVKESVRIIREAASALATAHRAGIIHRDVKPENILLDGPERRVLVTDFGIAKTLDAGAQGLTGTGMLVGTPQYMSPEQAAGDRNIDHRSDQYALGVVGYRLLAGQLPFDGDTPQTIIFRQVTEAARPIAELSPDVPRPIAAAIERALSKNPNDRFESMDAFNAALEDATHEATPTSGRQPVPNMGARIETMRRELPRWRSPLVIASVVVTVAGLALTPRTISRAAHQDAARREDAIFAAKSFLAARGVTGPLQHFATFRNRDTLSARKFLKEAIGAKGLNDRASADLPLWAWRVSLKGDSLHERWTVDIGRGNRVVAFARPLEDSASAPSSTLQQAAALATNELIARGLTPTSLRRLGDSTVTRPNRTDYFIRWSRPDAAIHTAGDTAFPTTIVRVSGDAVTGYSEFVYTPRRFFERTDSATLDATTGMLVAVLFMVAIGVAIFVIVSQSRRDELQWRTGWIVTLVVIATSLPSAFSTIRESLLLDTSTANLASGTTTVALGLLFMGGAMLLGAVVVESLSAMYRPAMFGGVTDLTRGRVAPELASSAANGLLWGGLTFAALQSVDLAYALFTGGPPKLSVDEFVWTDLTALNVIDEMSGAFAVVLFSAAVQLIVYRWRRSAILAVVVPVTIVLAVMVAMPDGRSISALTTAVGFSITGLVTWRHGLVAGALAALLSSVLQGFGPALWIGTSGGIGGLALASAVVLALLAPGFIAYRRFRGIG